MRLEVSNLSLGLAEVERASLTSGKVILCMPRLNMAKYSKLPIKIFKLKQWIFLMDNILKYISLDFSSHVSVAMILQEELPFFFHGGSSKGEHRFKHCNVKHA